MRTLKFLIRIAKSLSKGAIPIYAPPQSLADPSPSFVTGVSAHFFEESTDSLF